MPAFRVSAQLRFVDGDKGVLPRRARHGFGGAEEIARIGWFDPFLAGDQRHLLITLDTAHPVIHLTRQQPQGETHHAG